MPSNAVRRHPLWLFDRRQMRASPCPGLVGVDEAGRGALAGPVVAAAAYIPAATYEQRAFRRDSRAINDSKQLKPEQRDAQFSLIENWRAEAIVWVGCASASVEEIGERNILGATRLAMRRALDRLELPLPRADAAVDGDLLARLAHQSSAASPDAGPRADLAGSATLQGDTPSVEPADYPRLLVDGKPLKPFPWRHEGVVGGDGKSLAIAMASIVAKVTRDRAMMELHGEEARYGFDQHKGYGAPTHLEALRKHGPCAHHRRLFLRKINGVAKTAQQLEWI